MDVGLLRILILLQVSGGILGSYEDWNWYKKNFVPMRCKFLLEESQVYLRMCQGTYPLVAYTKYRDMLIHVGEPFAIYLSPSLESVLVVQKRSPLRSCLNLKFVNSNTFLCLDDNRNKTIFLPVATIFCFPFHIQLPDDLMNECLTENEVNWRMHKHQLYEVLRTRRTILHYTFDESGVPSIRIPKLLFILLLQSLFINLLS